MIASRCTLRCRASVLLPALPLRPAPARRMGGASYAHQGGGRPLLYQTVGEALQRAAERWPQRPCLVAPADGLRLTFAELLEEADRLGAGLLESGLEPGDKLAIFSPNSVRWLTLLLGASRAGLIGVPLNPLYQEREVEFCLKKLRVQGLAMPASSHGRNYGALLQALQGANLPSLNTIIALDDRKLNGVITYTEVLSRSSPAAAQALSSSQHHVSPDSDFVIMFTSGTTGEPKAAVLSHFAYANNSWELGSRGEFSDKYHKICLQLPMFHAFGLLTIVGALQHGCTVVIPYAFYDVQRAVRAIEQERCTVLTGTPTMYVDLVRHQRSACAPFGGAEVALTGGAPCSGQLGLQMRDHLGIRALKSVYGMTESCVVFQNAAADALSRATDSVGMLCPHVQVKVADSEGRAVAAGQPGELYVRSYANMRGYFEDPAGTAAALDPRGWLRTGDQFVLSEDGYGQIAGRIKDIIIRGGENILPKEIEDFLNTHPDIIESHVFGVSDDRLGEEICVGVRLREGAQMEYSKLRSFCSSALASFKVPRHLRVLNQFPLTPSGKVQKFKLREMMERGQI